MQLGGVEYEIHSTKAFNQWFKSLKDPVAKRKVLARIENGNFGDHQSVSGELSELRLFFGGGLRIYYTIRNGRMVLLLGGGDKSTQSRDIEKAKTLLSELE